MSFQRTRPPGDTLQLLLNFIHQMESAGNALLQVVAGTQNGAPFNLTEFQFTTQKLPTVSFVPVTQPVDSSDQIDNVRSQIEATGKTVLFIAPIFDETSAPNFDPKLAKMIAVCRDGPAAVVSAGGVTANAPVPGASPPGGAGPSVTLSWDNVPLRKEWSRKLIDLVSQNKIDLEKGNPDGFVSGYSTLPSAALKIKFWAELLVAVARFESDWNPNNVFHEPPPLGVNSIGLLQLSLQDQDNYHLTPRISIEEELKKPLINLEWGVTIFTKLLVRDGVVASGSSISNARGAARYWSVLWAGHKIDEIKTLTKKNVGL